MSVAPAVTTLAPIPASFNCAATAALPFGGAEVLVIAALFLCVVVSFCTVFLDVAAKQMWPTKYLNKAVAKRIADLQAAFPLLGADDEEVAKAQQQNSEDAALKSSPIPTYTRVVAQEAYIAGHTVDDDLLYILANKDAFGTVSSYCSSTVRGYAMLSMVLPTAGVSLSFLWLHNAIIDPTGSATWPSYLILLGYILILLTGTVMCGPNGKAVNRKANICIMGNLPLSLDGKHNPLLDLHEIGIGSFLVLPLGAHLYMLWTGGSSQPNYAGIATGVSWQILGALCFGLPYLFPKTREWRVFANKCSIIGEIIAVFASFLSYMQCEFYATAVCARYETGFHSLLLAAAFAPFALVVRNLCFQPELWNTNPSVMLQNGGEPVAVSGPMPILAFDGKTVVLPHVDQ